MSNLRYGSKKTGFWPRASRVWTDMEHDWKKSVAEKGEIWLDVRSVVEK